VGWYVLWWVTEDVQRNHTVLVGVAVRERPDQPWLERSEFLHRRLRLVDHAFDTLVVVITMKQSLVLEQSRFDFLVGWQGALSARTEALGGFALRGMEISSPAFGYDSCRFSCNA